MKQKQEITFFVSSRLMSFLSFILSYPFSSVASFLPSLLPCCLFPNMFCVLHFFIPSFISSFLLPLLFICLILWWTLINPHLPCVAHKPPWILCISIRCHELHQAAAELAGGRRNDPMARMVQVEFLELQWQTEAGALWKPGTNGTLAALASRLDLKLWRLKKCARKQHVKC